MFVLRSKKHSFVGQMPILGKCFLGWGLIISIESVCRSNISTTYIILQLYDKFRVNEDAASVPNLVSTIAPKEYNKYIMLSYKTWAIMIIIRWLITCTWFMYYCWNNSQNGDVVVSTSILHEAIYNTKVSWVLFSLKRRLIAPVRTYHSVVIIMPWQH